MAQRFGSTRSYSKAHSRGSSEQFGSCRQETKRQSLTGQCYKGQTVVGPVMRSPWNAGRKIQPFKTSHQIKIERSSDKFKKDAAKAVKKFGTLQSAQQAYLQLEVDSRVMEHSYSKAFFGGTSAMQQCEAFTMQVEKERLKKRSDMEAERLEYEREKIEDDRKKLEDERVERFHNNLMKKFVLHVNKNITTLPGDAGNLVVSLRGEYSKCS